MSPIVSNGTVPTFRLMGWLDPTHVSRRKVNGAHRHVLDRFEAQVDKGNKRINNYYLVNGMDWDIENALVSAKADGVDDYLGNDNDTYETQTDPVILDLNLPFTVSLWVYPTADTILWGQGDIVGGDGFSGQISTVSSTRRFTVAGPSGGSTSSSTTVVPINQWLNLTFTKEGGASRTSAMYLNAKKMILADQAGMDGLDPTNSSSYLEWGRQEEGVDTFNYAAANVKFGPMFAYQHALSYAGVQQLYSASNSRLAL